MSKINQIQQAILELSGGAYQKLMDAYLVRRFGFVNISPLGSHSGTNKVTKGVPDSYVRMKNGRYIAIMYGAVSSNSFEKLKKDILDCLNTEKSGLVREKIARIICCHTSTNINIEQKELLLSLFDDVQLIGLGEVAFDLLEKYPDIARDHLYIELDTNQIFELDNFLKYDERNPYAVSLNMPLFGRKKEMSELGAMIENNQVTVVSGSAGVGKTRLAIECADNYAKEQKCEFRIIRSNGASIHADLHTAFSKNYDYVVLVDDANNLEELHYLLDMAMNELSDHSIKLILTVRDYVRDKVLTEVKNKLIPGVYKVDRLSHEAIAKILNEELSIKNPSAVNHICNIVKGNARLAVMMAKSALNGNIEVLQNAAEIYDYYYSNILSSGSGKLNREQLIVAGIISLVERVSFKNDESLLALLADKGINKQNFFDIVEFLHQREMVDLYEDKAVRIEDQNFRDYILYEAFIKSKVLTLSEVMIAYDAIHREGLVFSISTLCQLFGSEGTVKNIQREIAKVWIKIQSENSQKLLNFLMDYSVFIPDETLCYVKKQIDAMPTMPDNDKWLLEYNYQGNNNYHIIKSDIIRVLSNLKYTEVYQDAIRLALYYFEKDCRNPMDIYFLFTKVCGVDDSSHIHNYGREILLYDVLLQYHQQKNTVLSGLSLLFASNYLLQLNYTGSYGNSNRTVTCWEIGLKICDELFDLRKRVWKTLFGLLQDVRFRHLVNSSLQQYVVCGDADNVAQIVREDISTFADLMAPIANTDDYEICDILRHFENICEDNNVALPYDFPRSDQNAVYHLYKVLSENYIYKCSHNYEAIDSLRMETINKIAVEISIENFAGLCGLLAVKSKASQSDSVYWISKGIDLLFQSLARLDQNKFLQCCEIYIHYNTPYFNVSFNVICILRDVLGWNGAQEFVKSREFNFQKIWLAKLYNLIPDEDIDKNTGAGILDCLDSVWCACPAMVDLTTVLRVDAVNSGFLVSYVDKLKLHKELCGNFMWQVLCRDKIELNDFLGYFRENIQVLKDAYLVALPIMPLYGDNAECLLLTLIKDDRQFLEKFVRLCLKKDLHINNENIFNSLWKDDDYKRIVSDVMSCLMQLSGTFDNNVAEKILKRKDEDGLISERQDDWLKRYISLNYNNQSVMEFLFHVTCNLSNEQHLLAIKTFCKFNQSVAEFKRIPLLALSYSWSNSEVPIQQQRIKFIQSIKDELVGVAFIEHRQYLSQIICELYEYIERVKEREFLER